MKRPRRVAVLPAILIAGLLVGFGLFSALLGRSAAGSAGPDRSVNRGVADQLGVTCISGAAILSDSVVEAQPDGVHINPPNAEAVGLLRFWNDLNEARSVELNQYGSAVIALSPGRWYATCRPTKDGRTGAGTPLDVRGDASYYVPDQTHCLGAFSGITAPTRRAWTDPEGALRRVTTIGRSDVVEPSRYVAIALDPTHYQSFNYRVVRQGEVIARATISRKGMAIYGCVDLRR